MNTFFFGKVEHGLIVLDDGGIVLAHGAGDIALLLGKWDGEPVSIEISLVVPKHSDQARRYYFGEVVKKGAARLGYTSEEMHEGFKAALLIDRAKEPPRIRSLKELSVPEMYDYTEECRRLLAEAGCVTDDPDPLWWRK